MKRSTTAPLPFIVGYAEIRETAFRGQLQVPFSKLVEMFGEPQTSSPEDDSAFEWRITFADGSVASIYDVDATWGGECVTPEEMREIDYCDWRVGGRTEKAVELVRSVLATSPGGARLVTISKAACDDVLRIAESYARNARILRETLDRAGMPIGWLSGWDEKLARIKQELRREATGDKVI